MKKFSRIRLFFLLCCAFLFVFLAVSCNSGFDEVNTSNNAITVYLPGYSGGARGQSAGLVPPQAMLSGVSYQWEVSGGPGASRSGTVPEGATSFQIGSLAQGNWQLDVRAYWNGELLGTGIQTFNASPGVSVVVIMRALPDIGITSGTGERFNAVCHVDPGLFPSDVWTFTDASAVLLTTEGEIRKAGILGSFHADGSPITFSLEPDDDDPTDQWAHSGETYLAAEFYIECTEDINKDGNFGDFGTGGAALRTVYGGNVLLKNGATHPMTTAYIPIESAADLIELSEVVRTNTTIADTQQARCMRSPPKGVYMQMNDIDLRGTAFTPIGSDSGEFSGIYNGGGRQTIIALSGYTGYQGFFGCAQDARFENIHVAGSVNDSSGSGYVGGICGAAENCLIQNCSNAANVTSTNSYANYVGGICGYIYGGPLGKKIIGCRNTGNVTGAWVSIGGIAGGTDNGYETIIACYNTGSIQGGEKVGGILGAFDGSLTLNIVGCYNIGQVSGSTDTSTGSISGYRASLLQNYWKAGTAAKARGDSNDTTGAVQFGDLSSWPKDDLHCNEDNDNSTPDIYPWALYNPSDGTGYWKKLGTPGTENYPKLYWE